MRLNRELPYEEYERLESALYFDFVTYSARGSRFQTSWETLFDMRHHGVPTRLLDWSENFAMALYFALSGNPKSPTIWILNPYKLNQQTTGDASLFNPKELKFNYAGGYLDIEMKYDMLTLATNQTIDQPYQKPIAIVPPLSSDRLFAQKGLFTLQGKGDDTPLNKLENSSDYLVKVTIPNAAIEDALAFIQLSGINEFSAYPDLDGLSRYLKNKYKITEQDLMERKQNEDEQKKRNSITG